VRTSLLVIVVTLAACGEPTLHSSGFNHCNVPQDGILLLQWTVHGAPPSATSCAGIDHLVLDFETESCGSGTIEPVPCTLTKFRYDDLPEGQAAITLTAVDAQGNPVARGSTQFDLEPNASAAPATLDVR
jgi:hypothetical protein